MTLFALRILRDIFTEVKGSSGKGNGGIQFIPEGSIEGKALQMDNENVRQLGYSHFLCGPSRLLTSWAVPMNVEMRERGIGIMRIRGDDMFPSH